MPSDAAIDFLAQTLIPLSICLRLVIADDDITPRAGKDVARPFPVVSPFGLPSMPEAPAAEAATPVIEEISTDNPADETKKAK